MVTKDQWVVQGWQSEKNREGVSEAQSRLLFLCQPSDPPRSGGRSKQSTGRLPACLLHALSGVTGAACLQAQCWAS